MTQPAEQRIGCEKHTAYIYDRGGMTRIAPGPLTDVIRVEWNRVRDDISLGNVIVANPGPDCERILEHVSTSRHELVIYRGKDRVWEGPITRMAHSRTTVEIEAHDVMHYPYRTILHAGYDNSHPNITTNLRRAWDMLTGELVRKETLTPPANVLPHVVVLHAAGDARTSRKTAPYAASLFEQLDDMASKSGMDYTVVGRAIILSDTHTVLGVTGRMTDSDFIGDIIVTEYGMETTTFSAVTDGNETYGVAGQDADPFYGNWEVLHSPFTEAEAGAEPPTPEELATQAERNRDGREHPPVEVRVPDGSRLNPNGQWSIQDLVPGVRVPLIARVTARTISQMQKLDKVRVVDEGQMESVMVTLSPASLNDTPVTETQDSDED
jgi:hypothetical protein